jgi:hypothetical protein
MSTMAAIFGQRVAPGLLDRYLGSTGYRSQQTREPALENPHSNLWEPVDDEQDYGAHGAFDHCASPSSVQLWGTLNRGKLALAGLGALGAAAALTRRRR